MMLYTWNTILYIKKKKCLKGHMVFGICYVLILPLGISKNIVLGLYLMLKQQKRYTDLFARKN